MTITYLKKAEKTAASGEGDVRALVAGVLAEIERGGEETAREYAAKFDKWFGEIIVPADVRKGAADRISQRTRDDIQFAHDRVLRFAQAQMDSMQNFETELSPGLITGQKLVPMQAAGCYVPGGRYAHIASAIMTTTTARAAGVKKIVACSPPRGEDGIDPAILYALDLCGADHILCMGGIQGIAAMTFGLFTGIKVDILVGPGNQFVAEAKRILYGRVGIDMFAGPTEIAVIADATGDPDVIACDIASQVEHGYNSPGWLISIDRGVAEAAMALVPKYIETLPELNRKNAEEAWRDHGEVIVCDNREEAVEVSDAYAAEHLEVHCDDLDWWLANLNNYGSLFLGEETTVTYGDKSSGPNHVLPTKGAARHTGGLSVHKFIKVLTWQRMSREANRDTGAVAARISRAEGMEGHARAGDVRLAKYFPGEEFELRG